MSNWLSVLAPDTDDFRVTAEQFRAAITHWLPHAGLGGPVDHDDPLDITIFVTRPAERSFHIFHGRDGDMISTDAPWEQAVEVAVWAADSFPMNGSGELWLVDQAYTGHAVLGPGMSPDEVRRGWREHV